MWSSYIIIELILKPQSKISYKYAIARSTISEYGHIITFNGYIHLSKQNRTQKIIVLDIFFLNLDDGYILP